MSRPRRAKRLSRNRTRISLDQEMIRAAKADALDFVAAFLTRGQVDLGYTPDPRAWALMGALAELASDAAVTRWPELNDNAKAAVLRATAKQMRDAAKSAV